MREFAPAGEIKLPPDATTVKAINLALREMHGIEVANSRPRFRISWSTTSSEVRYGTYSIYYMEHIFLRDETGYVACAKYPNNPDRWVLEMLVYAPIAEVPESRNGHYEPLYVFQDKKGEYLPPLHQVAEIIIWALKNPEKNLVERLEREDKRKFAQEVAYFEDILEDTTGSVLVTALRDKEAIVVPSNYETPTGVMGITKGEL